MYIHDSLCISAQETFLDINIETVHECKDKILAIIEPSYPNIPLGVLRRMGKAVRISVGCAIPLIEKNPNINGIIIGSANGGMEDCIKFLNQVIQYEEGTLTPTNFVQSTPNALAAQIGLLSKNFGWNSTHVHNGLAFENALLDSHMLLLENPENTYLIGGVDEISPYNYNIENLGNWFKDEYTNNLDLYNSNTKGSIAGEGVSMFIVNNNAENALCKIKDFSTLESSNDKEISNWMDLFLEKNNNSFENTTHAISGENGDVRTKKYFELFEQKLSQDIGIIRYKHVSGEYPTSSAFAVWLASRFLTMLAIPTHMIKRTSTKESSNTNYLIYNTSKGNQHQLYFLSKK